MSLRSLFRVEIKRIALSKMFWMMAISCGLSFLHGYYAYYEHYVILTTNTYILDPVKSGTWIGSVIWALFVIYELDRVYRCKADTIMEAIVPPVRKAFAQYLSFIVLSMVVCLVCMLLYLPYTIYKMDYLFRFDLYFFSFIILPLPTWIISLSIATALYQVLRRIELASFLYMMFALWSAKGVFGEAYFSNWIDPIVISYSDGYSSNYYLRIAIYTRLLWLLLAIGFWLFSLICLRKYQKGLIGSFLIGIKKIWIPIFVTVFVTCGILMWKYQPIVNHAPLEQDYSVYAVTEQSFVNVSEVSYDLTADTFLGRLSSIAEYTVTKEGSLEDNIEDMIKLNCGYEITSITCNGEELDFVTLDNDTYDYRDTVFVIPIGQNQLVRIEYEGFPQENRAIATIGEAEINPEHIQLYNASSTPLLNANNQVLKTNVSLTIPSNLTPTIEHKLLTDFTDNLNGTKTWQISLDFTNGFLWISAGDYVSDTISAAGADVKLLYSRRYENMVNENGIRESLADVMEYCSSHLGSCPWVRDVEMGEAVMLQHSGITPGGIAGKGWLEWSEDVFNISNLDDTSKGAGPAEVFAHEIVHQWWGGYGVNCGSFEDELWTEEGITVYTTYRIMKEKFGELYARQNYVNLWQETVDRQDRSFYNRHPEALQALPEQYRVQIALDNRGINHYHRMPLMILKAEALVGGEEEMDKILQQVQKDYLGEKQGEIFTFEKFLEYCGLSKEDLEL